MKDLPANLLQKLLSRDAENSRRMLPTQNTLVDFSSNDYLGLAASGHIFRTAHQYLLDNVVLQNGATGSRLISGNHKLYQSTEGAIASFHQSESALIFNSGYDANVGLFSCVPQKGDLVLYDEFIHASVRDGIRLSNATPFRFAHNNTAALEKLITRHKSDAGNIYVAVESVFSMDGDCAPLQELTALALQYNCRLIVDEAHALGVFGEKGDGLVQCLNLQDKIFARIVTFGKGLGCHGAAILGSADLTSYLVNFARSFIYTTALPPHSVATIKTAYDFLETGALTDLEKLKDIIGFFTSEAKRLELGNYFIPGTSAIHCAIVPGNDRVRNISSVLERSGYNVKAILSPTVPQGQERLRFCLHSFNTANEVTGVLSVLQQALR